MIIPIRFSKSRLFRQLLVVLIGIAFWGVHPQSIVYSSTPDQTNKVPRFVEGNCPYIFPKEDWNNVDQKRFRCGYFVTWENYDAQNRTIWLSVMEAYPTGSTPSSDPIIRLSGGPGASGFEVTPALTLDVIDRYFGRGWIQFSQRGSYLSEAELKCP